MRVLVLSLALSGCGGASLVLRSPVESQCSSAGLRGCDHVADGVVQYIEGDKETATKSLAQAAASNSPHQVRTLAKLVRELAGIPGAGQYAATVSEIADVLEANAPTTVSTTPRGGDVQRKQESHGRWEYLVKTISADDLEPTLNTLGGRGWELSVRHGADGYVFKRPAGR